MQAEIQNLDDEVNQLRRKNEDEKLTIQNLELALIKRRRRAEKCRQLAEAQSLYRTTLEKMIRDAVHQSVIYKEQLRLNQAASSALMARLEALKAICDASEKELHKKYKERDEFETQIRPEWEQTRKRSRMDDALAEEKDSMTVLYLPAIKPRTPLYKELRVFLEEEQKASDAALSQNNEDDRRIEPYEELERPKKRLSIDNLREQARYSVALEDKSLLENQMRRLEIEGKHKFQFPVIREQEIVEDEERRKECGKGKLEKWLQILLDSSPEELDPQNESANEKHRVSDIISQIEGSANEKHRTGDIISQMNLKYPHGVKNVKCPQAEAKEGVSKQQLIVQEG